MEMRIRPKALAEYIEMKRLLEKFWKMNCSKCPVANKEFKRAKKFDEKQKKWKCPVDPRIEGWDCISRQQFEKRDKK